MGTIRLGHIAGPGDSSPDWDGSVITVKACNVCDVRFTVRVWPGDPAKTAQNESDIIRAHSPYCCAPYSTTQEVSINV